MSSPRDEPHGQTGTDGHTSPTEAARVYAFLASSDAAGLNGISVRADSGLFAHQPFTPDMTDFGMSVSATAPTS